MSSSEQQKREKYNTRFREHELIKSVHGTYFLKFLFYICTYARVYHVNMHPPDALDSRRDSSRHHHDHGCCRRRRRSSRGGGPRNRGGDGAQTPRAAFCLLRSFVAKCLSLPHGPSHAPCVAWFGPLPPFPPFISFSSKNLIFCPKDRTY